MNATMSSEKTKHQPVMLDQVNQDTQEPRIFENINSEKEGETKEPEMFEESNLEEDFEIPAFLRRQKN